MLIHVTCHVHVQKDFCAIWKRVVRPTRNPALLALYSELAGQQQFFISIWAGFGARSGLGLGYVWGRVWGKKLYMDPILYTTSIWAVSWAVYGAVFWDKKSYMDPIFLCMVNYINLGYVLGYGLCYGLGCDFGKETFIWILYSYAW